MSTKAQVASSYTSEYAIPTSLFTGHGPLVYSPRTGATSQPTDRAQTLSTKAQAAPSYLPGSVGSTGIHSSHSPGSATQTGATTPCTEEAQHASTRAPIAPSYTQSTAIPASSANAYTRPGSANQSAVNSQPTDGYDSALGSQEAQPTSSPSCNPTNSDCNISTAQTSLEEALNASAHTDTPPPPSTQHLQTRLNHNMLKALDRHLPPQPCVRRDYPTRSQHQHDGR